MHLRLVEPEAAGHHIALHARYIALDAVRRGWRVSLSTTAATTRHPAFALLRRDVPALTLGPAIDAVPFPAAAPSGRNLLRYQFAQARAFRAAVADAGTPDGPDAVYVVNLDYCDKAIALAGSPFGRTAFAGMLMSVRFHHARLGVATPAPRLPAAQAWLFGRLLATPRLRALLTIDDTLGEYAAGRPGARFRKVVAVPDLSAMAPDGDPAAARRRLGVAPERTVVLLYGALSLRKGVAALLDALGRAPGGDAPAALLVGAPDDAVRELLAGPLAARLRAEGRLYEHLGFADAAVERDAFAAADIVWLGYQGFYGMSGVLVQAARAGRPVVATREGLIGWFARRHGLGPVVNVGDPDDVAAALRRLAADPALRGAIAEQGRAVGARHAAPTAAARIGDAIAAIA